MSIRWEEERKYTPAIIAITDAMKEREIFFRIFFCCLLALSACVIQLKLQIPQNNHNLDIIPLFISGRNSSARKVERKISCFIASKCSQDVYIFARNNKYFIKNTECGKVIQTDHIKKHFKQFYKVDNTVKPSRLVKYEQLVQESII